MHRFPDERFIAEAVPAQSIAEARQRLSEDTAALLYHFSGDNVIIFLLDKRGLRLKPYMTNSSELFHKTLSFIAWMDRSAREFDRHNRDQRGNLYIPEPDEQGSETFETAFLDKMVALSDLLVPPEFIDAIDEFSHRKLLIIPDEHLFNFPFHCLFNERTGKYLLDKFEGGIFYAPSLNVYSMCKQKALERVRRGAGYAAIREAVAELEKDMSAPPRILAERANGEIPEEPSRLRLVHIIGHGAFFTEDPMSSYISLSEGPLRARDVAGPNFRFDQSFLVTLEVCGAARTGRLRIGEQAGLWPAFLASGAVSVFAPLWPLPPSWNSRMMGLLYSALLAEGFDKAKAAKRVMNTIRHDQSLAYDSFRNPLLWGNFILIGSDV